VPEELLLQARAASGARKRREAWRGFTLQVYCKGGGGGSPGGTAPATSSFHFVVTPTGTVTR
jgi:hypothetical protein